MPEGAEVNLMAHLVREAILHKTIIKLVVLPGCKQTGVDSCSGGDLTVSAVESNGKLMWIEFTNAKSEVWWAFFTFGLAGGWCKGISAANRLELVCKDQTTLFFRDNNNYGSITVTKDPKVYAKKLKERGHNLFGNTPLTYDAFLGIVRKAKKINICDFLLTKQNGISGIGNYLKCEILYHAQISPWRSIDTLLEAELRLLHKAITVLCQRALLCNGRAYRYTDLIPRESCTFENEFAVYERTTDPLGNIVLCEKSLDGRKSYWVKAVQH